MASPRRGRPSSPPRRPRRSRSASFSRSSSSSSSRSRPPRRLRSASPTRSSSSSSSRSRGARSRSRSPSLQSGRKALPVPKSVVLLIAHLTRNINEGHLTEIFSTFGEVVDVELVIDCKVNVSRGFGYVQFRKRVDAEKALLYMDGGQIDGNVVSLNFTLTLCRKVSPPPEAIPSDLRKEALHEDKVGDAAENAAKQQQQIEIIESSPQHKPLYPSSKRTPPGNQWPNSSPRRLVRSSVHRQADSSHNHHGGSRSHRRAPSPSRRRSPPPASWRIRERGSLFHRRSQMPHRRSPLRQARNPSRKSPPPCHRSRSPVRRLAHSQSRSFSRGRSPPPHCRSRSPVWRLALSRPRSISPRRGQAPPPRRRRSSSTCSRSRSPPKRAREAARSPGPRRSARGRISKSPESSSPPTKT